MKKILAIIPARGGSKGIKDKNISNIAGKNLIDFTIEQAIESQVFDKIVVSSDSKQILEIASKFSVELLVRPAEISGDTSPITETILDVLNRIDEKFDLIVLLQPTSPIRLPNQIRDAISKLVSNPKANSLISVCEMDDVHPGRMYWKHSLEPDLYMEPIFEEFETKRRQDLPKALFRNGAIYIVKTEEFIKYQQLMVNPVLYYSMPVCQLLNIDHPRDLEIAEVLLKYNGII